MPHIMHKIMFHFTELKETAEFYEMHKYYERLNYLINEAYKEAAYLLKKEEEKK